MARQLTSIIVQLTDKVRDLAQQRDEALAASEDLRKRIEDLELKLQDALHEIELSKMETDFLIVSHRLADDPDHLVAARRRIKRMIAKIDRCVALLKGDADIS